MFQLAVELENFNRRHYNEPPMETTVVEDLEEVTDMETLLKWVWRREVQPGVFLVASCPRLSHADSPPFDIFCRMDLHDADDPAAYYQLV